MLLNSSLMAKDDTNDYSPFISMSIELYLCLCLYPYLYRWPMFDLEVLLLFRFVNGCRGDSDDDGLSWYRQYFSLFPSLLYFLKYCLWV